MITPAAAQVAFHRIGRAGSGIAGTDSTGATSSTAVTALVRDAAKAYLVSSFSYLDLVLQDTPLNDLTLKRTLRRQVEEVDNLSDREDQKLARMQVRFDRVRTFLDYLQAEEQGEQNSFDLPKSGGIWSEPIIPGIREQIEDGIAWIEKRLRENRERIAEDIKFNYDEEDAEVVSDREDLRNDNGSPSPRDV